MSFTITGGLFGAGLVLAAGLLGIVPARKPDLWRTVPRDRVAGAVIGVLCLVWSALLVQPLLQDALPGLARLLWIIVIVVSVGSILYLDYLFTRAMGGLLLLSTTHIMREAFIHHAPARWLLSIACYVLAIAGMFMIGSPWRFRDLLKLVAEKRKHRHLVAGVLLGIGLLAIVIAAATRAPAAA